MKTKTKKPKKIITIVFLFIIFYSFNVSAIAVVPIYTNNNQQANGQGSGCSPPIDFAIENQCSLSYYSTKSVNTFICGDFIVEGDCKGGIIKYTELFSSKILLDHSLMVIILIMTIIIGLYLISKMINCLNYNLGERL